VLAAAHEKWKGSFSVDAGRCAALQSVTQYSSENEKGSERAAGDQRPQGESESDWAETARNRERDPLGVEGSLHYRDV